MRSLFLLTAGSLPVGLSDHLDVAVTGGPSTSRTSPPASGD